MRLKIEIFKFHSTFSAEVNANSQPVKIAEYYLNTVD